MAPSLTSPASFSRPIRTGPRCRQNEVVLPYVSMHGSTEKMAFALLDSLVARDVKVHLFDLVVTDIGKLAISLVDAATLVLGSPTVHVGPHPAAHYAANLANAIRPKVRFASLIGSYGWSTRMVEQVAGMLPNLKAEILDRSSARAIPRNLCAARSTGRGHCRATRQL